MAEAVEENTEQNIVAKSVRTKSVVVAIGIEGVISVKWCWVLNRWTIAPRLR